MAVISGGATISGGVRIDPPSPPVPRKIGVGSNYANSFMGRAYIYNTDGTGEIILDKPAGVTEQFGTSIAMSDTKLVVGASATNGYSGKVYTYNLDGTGEQEITASDGGGSYHLFGKSVAISDTKVVVGASGDDDSGDGSGAVYVYNLDGTGEVKITASDGFDNDNFGWSVAITDTKIVVGAQYNDDPNNSGSVYVYNLDGTGEQKITASDGVDHDWFGSSVVITDTKIFVGAAGNNGAVYVYNTDGTGELKITASDGNAGDRFGESVAISGTKVVVGARDDDSKGAVYVYNTDGTGEQKITASDGAANDQFGGSVAGN
jgi:Tol biopolymer transport system component